MSASLYTPYRIHVHGFLRTVCKPLLIAHHCSQKESAMDISSQDMALPRITAKHEAHAIDTKAEFRDGRWWADCPLQHDDADVGQKSITIWDGLEGPVIRYLCEGSRVDGRKAAAVRPAGKKLFVGFDPYCGSLALRCPRAVWRPSQEIVGPGRQAGNLGRQFRLSGRMANRTVEGQKRPRGRICLPSERGVYNSTILPREIVGLLMPPDVPLQPEPKPELGQHEVQMQTMMKAPLSLLIDQLLAGEIFRHKVHAIGS